MHLSKPQAQASGRLKDTKHTKSMFCDFLSDFRVLELIKSEASLKQTSYPKCKISILIFAWNVPLNLFACYSLQQVNVSVRGQVIFLVFHRPTAVEEYRAYANPLKLFMNQQGKPALPVVLNTSSGLLFSTLCRDVLAENVPCPCKADELCYKSTRAAT